MLTQSRRLHKFFQGKFLTQVLNLLTTTPYRCNLSSETVKVVLDFVLAETNYHSAVWDEDRELFVQQLQNELNPSDVVRWKPTLHAELAMIRAMVKGEIKNVMPYIGVSKLSCIICSHCIRTYNKITEQQIATKGSHRKAYPGWFWPSLPSHDGELRPSFIRAIQQQLLSDFEEHIATKKRARQSSDSNVGSGFPELRLAMDDDDILQQYNNNSRVHTAAEKRQ